MLITWKYSRWTESAKAQEFPLSFTYSRDWQALSNVSSLLLVVVNCCDHALKKSVVPYDHNFLVISFSVFYRDRKTGNINNKINARYYDKVKECFVAAYLPIIVILLSKKGWYMWW